MAKDIKLFKGEYSIKINETQLDSFFKLGYTLDKEEKPKNKKDKSKWQHTTEKKES